MREFVFGFHRTGQAVRRLCENTDYFGLKAFKDSPAGEIYGIMIPIIGFAAMPQGRNHCSVSDIRRRREYRRIWYKKLSSEQK